jgi:T-complex protein 1 subunit zeta
MFLLQDDVTGDGTTSTVLLCGELMRQAERYTAEGLHPRIITDGFDIARDATIAFLDTFKVSMTADDEKGNAVEDRELLRCIASTSLKTKLDHELAEKVR